MSIDLHLTRETPVIVHGIDHPACGRVAGSMRRFGTNVAAYVSSTADTDMFDGLPLFRHCADAISATKAEILVSMAQPRTAAGAVLDAAEAGVRMIVSLSTGVPVHDSMRVCRRIHDLGITLIGPGSSGLAIPAAGVKLGAMPDAALRPGDVAVISASGGLAAEAGYQMGAAGLGQSLYIDVGDGAIKGTRMGALATALKTDASTRAVVLLGTFQSAEEEEFAAEMRAIGFDKPVLAYIAGRSLPDIGGAAASEFPETPSAARKEAALADAGATVYNSLGALVAALKPGA